MTRSTEGRDDQQALDSALRSLPRGLEPQRDLWPGIAVRLEPVHAARRRRWYWSAAAAVLLVVASSLLTATWLRHRAEPLAHAAAPSFGGANAVPASFGPAHVLSPEYEAARRQLTVMLQQRVAQMPPSARRKLEANLAELRHAAGEINDALDQAPGDPLLEELLLNTYQEELAVLAAANQLTGQNPAGVPADATRMQL
jgi:hypothetical protein